MSQPSRNVQNAINLHALSAAVVRLPVRAGLATLILHRVTFNETYEVLEFGYGTEWRSHWPGGLTNGMKNAISGRTRHLRQLSSCWQRKNPIWLAEKDADPPLNPLEGGFTGNSPEN